MTTERGSDFTENEYLINPKPKYSTKISNHIEQDLMENHPQGNKISSSNPIQFSTNSKEEDSPTTNHHSDKENTKLNLETNYFCLDKAKGSKININEEISEEISNRQKKKDQ
ncbi:hypothetical protein O181_066365 [Austropuccinia psidii MF-1]|uniref:Uncharacterized protein n=1 Tax=Austropuccinia psidii MF-1 TaxID=1389203 RepID=A0A9Q3ENX0_9BASI|nr:hypothetical protein [Austropuccinia psidii MF-1]